MNLIVCVKRTPDTAAKIKLAQDAKSIDPEGVEFVLNPYDEYALEEALRLKEKAGSGEVKVVSVGASETTSVIRTCLAMGADSGVLLKTSVPFAESYAVAKALADYLKNQTYDLLLFGKTAVDDDQAQTGAIVAALLGLPYASVVVKLELQDDKVEVHREVEGAHEVVELPRPCAFAAEKGLNEPRYASLKGIMQAKRKKIEEIEITLQEPAFELTRMEYPPERPPGKIVGEGAEAVPELVRLLREEAKVI